VLVVWGLRAPSIVAGILLCGPQQIQELSIVVPSAPYLSQSVPKTGDQRGGFVQPSCFTKTPDCVAMTGTIHVHEDA